MIENRAPIDRAILVGAPNREVTRRILDEHLEELALLETLDERGFLGR